MRLLVLGGGGFLGYHVASEALGQGHEVTAFSREGEAPLEGVEPLQGDRYEDLSALRGREWDAVLDTFSDPEAVAEAARLLSGSVGVYGFVSGISNYHPEGPRGVDEDAPLRRPKDPTIPADDPLQERSIAKIRGEEAVRSEFSGPAFVVRPGILVGPRDPTDRFTWWPLRFFGALSGMGGVSGDLEVLAPGDPGRAVQYTDARDLADWAVRMLGKAAEGTFNGVGPGRRETLREVLEACLEAAGDEAGRDTGSVRLAWVEDEDFLRGQLPQVPEEERSLWFPEDQIPFDEVDSSKAIRKGLRFRSAYETARDVLAWARSSPRDDGPRAGFSREFERELLRRWRERLR